MTTIAPVVPTVSALPTARPDEVAYRPDANLYGVHALPIVTGARR